MKLSFSVDVPDSAMLREDVLEKARTVLWLSMHEMQTLAKRYAPVDVGLLRSSINLDPIADGYDTYTLSVGVDYGVYVEYGSGPHTPPIEPLKGWSRRVLGDEALAYAVRAKIAKEGVDAQPFIRPALNEVQKVHLPRIWANVMS